MYTIAQLKKMATERIHRIFEKIYGYSLFNPYEEREYMIVTILGHFMDKEELKGIESLGNIEFDVYFKETIVKTNNVVIDEFDNIFGISKYKISREINIGLSFSSNLIIDKINAAIRNHGKYEPVRTESKGRKSRWSFSEIMDMFMADIQGVRLSDIAKFYNTSSVVITQILTGKSYQWASGVNELSF